MDVADLLAPDRVIAGLPAHDKRQLLATLARRAAGFAGLPQDPVLEALASREALGSTGIGRGIAIPHARVPGLDRFVGLFASLDRPIAYDAVDGEPVDLVFLLLAPEPSGSGHLQALACITRRLRDQALADGLRRATTPGALYDALVGTAGAAPAPR